MNQRRLCKKISVNWRIVFILLVIVGMILAIQMIYSAGPGVVDDGKVAVAATDFKENKLVPLDGEWEFYWDRLLEPKDFLPEAKRPHMNMFMRVPGSWKDKDDGTNTYPEHGVATYRLKLNYPVVIKDPALKIQRVATAYKLYANGRLIVEVGKVSDRPSDFERGYEMLVVDLPKGEHEMELIMQVANLDYARGGFRESPVFGSKQVLERQKMILLGLQLVFVGSVFIFAIYYLFLFILQKQKAALFFSLLCFVNALSALVWGETPGRILFPDGTVNTGITITYMTEYNLMPSMILFVLSMYPKDYKKKIAGIILLPTLFFETLLLTPVEFMVLFESAHCVLIVVQMIYIIGILIKAVLHKRDNAVIMFLAIGVFVLSILADILNNQGIGSITISYMFLYGNLVVIIAMSYIQAKQQSDTNKKMILYNEQLVEADKLKDKIMATEMSFLQAQIKPHFLYNVLNTIAGVCEKDKKKAGQLILDLAIYLRGSLAFNHLDSTVTIEKEIEFAGTYFNIEQARFGQKIQMAQEIAVSLDFRIPVLILQPLVENAVRHGISKKVSGGTVRISMKQIAEGIYIEIKDDGVGIGREKLTMLLSETGIGEGGGLHNIHQRLIRLYGRGLDISSREGCGTCVRVVIPVRKMDGLRKIN
jgi:sensor histidine kinase YesM